MLAVHQAQIERKPTPLSAVLHRNHQGEFVHERTKGFWMKLAVVSWIVSRLLIQSTIILLNSVKKSANISAHCISKHAVVHDAFDYNACLFVRILCRSTEDRIVVSINRQLNNKTLVCYSTKWLFGLPTNILIIFLSLNLGK